MKAKEVAKLLANRVNQEHYILELMTKLYKVAYEKGKSEALNMRGVVRSDKVCSHKGDKVKMPYLEWIEFAESETAKGNKQIECMTCLRWFWPSEF